MLIRNPSTGGGGRGQCHLTWGALKTQPGGANTQAHLLTLGLREDEDRSFLLVFYHPQEQNTSNTPTWWCVCGEAVARVCLPCMSQTHTHTHEKLPIDVWIISKTLKWTNNPSYIFPNSLFQTDEGEFCSRWESTTAAQIRSTETIKAQQRDRCIYDESPHQCTVNCFIRYSLFADAVPPWGGFQPCLLFLRQTFPSTTPPQQQSRRFPRWTVNLNINDVSEEVAEGCWWTCRSADKHQPPPF